MYSAEQARKDWAESTVRKGTIFDMLKLKYIETKIKRASKREETSIYLNYAIDYRMKLQLERMGYCVNIGIGDRTRKPHTWICWA